VKSPRCRSQIRCQHGTSPTRRETIVRAARPMSATAWPMLERIRPHQADRSRQFRQKRAAGRISAKNNLRAGIGHFGLDWAAKTGVVLRSLFHPLRKIILEEFSDQTTRHGILVSLLNLTRQGFCTGRRISDSGHCCGYRPIARRLCLIICSPRPLVRKTLVSGCCPNSAVEKRRGRRNSTSDLKRAARARIICPISLETPRSTILRKWR